MMKNRFDELFSVYAEKKGFVAKTGSPLYLSCLARFNCFQTWYQNEMPLSQFEELVVDCTESNPEPKQPEETLKDVLEKALELAFKKGESWGVCYSNWFQPTEADTKEKLDLAVKEAEQIINSFFADIQKYNRELQYTQKNTSKSNPNE